MKPDFDLTNLSELAARIDAGCRELTVPVVSLADCRHRALPENLPSVEEAASCAGGSDPFGRVWRFDSGEGVAAVTNAFLLQIRKSTKLGRGVVDSLTWCVNEVMDNVLNHSAPEGRPCGYVMGSYDGRSHALSVSVCDWGIGLLASLSGPRYSPADERESIELALSKGVTRDTSVGQGNGLWGLHEIIARAGGGRLYVQTGSASWRLPPILAQEPPLLFDHPAGIPPGTFVDFKLKCSQDVPFEAVFPDNAHLTDLWLENLEVGEHDVRLLVREIVSGCGTRMQGRHLRNVVQNLVEIENKRVVLDFGGVTFCSSSFADELMGRLMVHYGFLDCAQRIVLVNTQGIRKGVFNRSVMQRMAAAESGGLRGRKEKAR